MLSNAEEMALREAIAIVEMLERKGEVRDRAHCILMAFNTLLFTRTRASNRGHT